MWQPLIDFVKKPSIRFRLDKPQNRHVKDSLFGFQTP